MNAISAFAALATIFTAGYGAFGLVVRTAKNSSCAEQFALSWLFGTCVVSLSLWLFGFFLHGLVLCGAVVLLCVLLPIVTWKKTHGFRSSGRFGPTETVLISLFVFQIIAITLL